MAEQPRRGAVFVATSGHKLGHLGERPGGEARNIHDLNGRYVSFLGTNAWFHQEDDRWPETVDVAQTVRVAPRVVHHRQRTVELKRCRLESWRKR